MVDAATNDARKTFRHELDSLRGRGNPERSQLAEERLGWTRRAWLTGREDADLEKARFAVAWEWTRRLVDLLEEDPRVEADLRAVGSRSGQRRLPTQGVFSPSVAVTLACGTDAGRSRKSR